MAEQGLRLRVLPGELAVARLEPGAAFPTWARGGPLQVVTRTPRECSLVCDWNEVPAQVRREGPFRALEVEGPLDFALTGILSALLALLELARRGELKLKQATPFANVFISRESSGQAA